MDKIHIYGFDEVIRNKKYKLISYDISNHEFVIEADVGDVVKDLAQALVDYAFEWKEVTGQFNPYHLVIDKRTGDSEMYDYTIYDCEYAE